MSGLSKPRRSPDSNGSSRGARSEIPDSRGPWSVIARGQLIRDALDRALVVSCGRAGHRLDLFTGAFRIGNPVLVEIVRTGRDTARAFARIDHAGIAAMNQLVEVVLRLAVAARIADQALRELSILDAVLLLTSLAEGATVKADNRRVTEVGIDAVKAGGIGDRDINIVGPGHRLGDQDLLFLGWIHVTLTAHDQLVTLHGTVAPDFRKVAVVANDQTDLHALRTFGNIGAIAGIPAFDRYPWHDLAVFLDDLALVVHQDQGVVRCLVRMLLVAFAGEREHAPDLGLAARFRENLGLGTRDRRRGLVHLFRVIHDALGGIFREDHQVHARQSNLHANQHLGNLAGVVEPLGLGVQSRHLVVDDRDADCVVAAGNVTVKHWDRFLFQFGFDDRKGSCING